MLTITETLDRSPLTSLDDFGPMVEDVAEGAAEILERNAPGRQLPNVLGNSVQEFAPNRWGVGSYDDLGSAPEDEAPKGTIREFLRDYPEYKAAKGVPYWHSPWWYLPAEGKRKLFQEREMGKYGGETGKAPYWHVIDTGYGRRAYVKPTHYVNRSTHEIEVLIRQRIRDFMGL